MKLGNAWLQDSKFQKLFAKQIEEHNAAIEEQLQSIAARPQTIRSLMVEKFLGPTGWTTKLMAPDGRVHTVQGQFDSWAEYVGQLPPLSSQLFEDAVAHIEAHGWTQGADVDSDGRVCAQGAFGLWSVRKMDGFMLRDRDSDRHSLFRARNDEIMDLMGIDRSRWGSVVVWNDGTGRTKDEVVDALTLAAKKLRDLGR